MELRDWNDLLRDEDGMGTVEIILIIVAHSVHKLKCVLCGKIEGYGKGVKSVKK